MDTGMLIAAGAFALMLIVATVWLVQLMADRAAARRAQQLVQDLLTPAEYGTLVQNGYLEVPSRVTPDRVYRIPAEPDMVTIFDAGHATARLCLVPACTVPEQEQVLIHKLMLEAAELDYLKAANPF